MSGGVDTVLKKKIELVGQSRKKKDNYLNTNKHFIKEWNLFGKNLLEKSVKRKTYSLTLPYRSLNCETKISKWPRCGLLHRIAHSSILLLAGHYISSFFILVFFHFSSVLFSVLLACAHLIHSLLNWPLWFTPNTLVRNKFDN